MKNEKRPTDGGSPAVASGLLPKIFFWLVLAVYAFFTWNTMLRHEPWRDEAHAWLMARDAGIVEFFKLRVYDWSPALWYMVLMPFAKLGCPYLTMSIIHWFLALVVVALFLKKSPFDWWVKILFVFSYFMFWEYVISVRVYTIGILILFILASMYSLRFKRPYLYAGLIAMLFSANMHIIGMAGALCLAYALDSWLTRRVTKPVMLSLTIMALGLFALYLQVGLIPSDHMHTGNIFTEINVKYLVDALSVPFFVGVGPGILLWPAGVVLLVWIGIVLLARPVVFLIYLLNTLYLVYVISVKNGGIRHIGLILIGIIFCLWVAAGSKDEFGWSGLAPIRRNFDKLWLATNVALGVCLLISLPYGIFIHRMELKYDYSGGKSMANFIRANGLENHPIAAHRDAQAVSVLPYLNGKRFWYPTIRDYGCFIRQTRKRSIEYESMTYDNALDRIEEAFPDGSLLVMLDAPMQGRFTQMYRLLYKVDNTVFSSDERFFLYERVRQR